MSRPNIVFIVVDSLRADHLGCYGYPKPTSPCIDALAAQSVVFDRAFAAGIPTMPSFTTQLSGLHPYRHGITAHSSEQRLSEEVLLLPQLARQSGYVTIGIDNLVVQASGRGSWFARGFDHYSGFLYKPFSDQCEQLTDRALRFVEDFRHKPFLLFMHLWDPHSPYGPPPPYDTLHYQPEPGSAEKLARVKSMAPEYYEAFLGDMKLRVPDDYDYVVAQYDGEISYVDQQIGRVLGQLTQCGIDDNTIVLLLSDHGECFGEGDVYFDHHGLYDATIRIALMCRVPGATPARSQAMVSTEDLLPTLIESCGLTTPTYELTGKSLRPVIANPHLSHREAVISLESTRQASLCMRTEKWKLIQPITHDGEGHPLPDLYGRIRLPRVQLYDLVQDPAERHDVSDHQPAVRDAMTASLAQWRTNEVALRGGSDPLLEGLSLDYNDFMARLTSRSLRG